MKKKKTGRKNKKNARTAKKARAKKQLRRRTPARGKRTVRRRRRIRGRAANVEITAAELKGLGARAGGQSGDTQGLSGVELAGPESVEELAEEGQAFEAEVLSGVEEAADPDVAEVTTREVPEDDVPPEYREKE